MEAARAMAQGIENADHDAEVRCLPMVYFVKSVFRV